MDKKHYILILVFIIVSTGCSKITPVASDVFNQDIEYKIKKYDEIMSFTCDSGPVYLAIKLNYDKDFDFDKAFLDIISVTEGYELIDLVKKKYRKYGQPDLYIRFVNDDDMIYEYKSVYNKSSNSDYREWIYSSSENDGVYIYTLEVVEDVLLIKKPLNCD